MTVTPKNGLIILILGITSLLNLGNTPPVQTNQANKLIKNFFLDQYFISKSNFVEKFSTFFFRERFSRLELF